MMAAIRGFGVWFLREQNLQFAVSLAIFACLTGPLAGAGEPIDRIDQLKAPAIVIDRIQGASVKRPITFEDMLSVRTVKEPKQ
jgi:hypothetical protein